MNGTETHIAWKQNERNLFKENPHGVTLKADFTSKDSRDIFVKEVKLLLKEFKA